QVIGDGAIVVALDAPDVVLVQQGKHAVWKRAERAEVPQAEARLRSPGLCIRERGPQREIVAVNAPEDGDFSILRHRAAVPKDWHKVFRTDNRCDRPGAPGESAPTLLPALFPAASPGTRSESDR